LQEYLGLNQYGYGARFYDVKIGRWPAPDKYAEVYYSLAPYAYTGNNLVNAAEVDGHLFIFASGFMVKQYLWGQDRNIHVMSPLGISLMDIPKQNVYAPIGDFIEMAHTIMRKNLIIGMGLIAYWKSIGIKVDVEPNNGSE